MAKRKKASKRATRGVVQRLASAEAGVVSAVKTGEAQLVDFAGDLARLLGSARGKAEEWLGQRENLTRRLAELRDTATGLLSKLGTPTERRKPGRPSSGKAGSPASPRRGRPPGKKKRTMSPAARAAISAAQKLRWAKQKAHT
jgi:hypothetical protein